MEDDLKHKIKKGLSWVFIGQVVNQLLFVWFAIYLARILSPSLFGIMGLVTVLTNYASCFVDLGFGTALVQRKDLDQGHLSTVFWFNLAVGILFSFIFYYSASLVAALYEEPQLKEITQVVSISFVITCLSLVQSNLLDKQLNFKKKVTISWISTFSGYAIGIVLALQDYGVWSLVAQLLTTQLVNTVILWVTSSWYPSFIFSKAKLRDLLPFGLSVFGDTSINYWSRNSDNFLIGKFIGSEGLGLYSRAYSLMLLPVRNVSSMVSRVMFPAFASIQDDVGRIRSIYLRTIKFIAFITFPAMAGLTVVAREFVLVCFGEKWAPMIPILQWLAILGAFQSILNLNGAIYNSIGKPHIALRVSLVTSVILLASFIVGLSLGGLQGLTIAYFVAGTILSLPVYHMAIKQLDIGFKEVFRTLSGSILSTTIMASFVFIYTRSVPFMEDLFVLLTSVVLGIIVYVIALFYADKNFREIVHRLKFGIVNLFVQQDA